LVQERRIMGKSEKQKARVKRQKAARREREEIAWREKMDAERAESAKVLARHRPEVPPGFVPIAAYINESGQPVSVWRRVTRW